MGNSNEVDMRMPTIDLNQPDKKMYLVDSNQPKVEMSANSQKPVEEKIGDKNEIKDVPQEQPQLNENLADYINDLLNSQVDKDIQNLKISAPNEQSEENITLHGRITNTPDVVESDESQKESTQYLDSKGNVHKIDKDGNEKKEELSIWDKIFNKTKENIYNLDSWINVPSDEMDKKKTDILLEILTAPVSIGEGASLNLASKLLPFLDKEIAKRVAEGVGSGTVKGAIKGSFHAAENSDNPIITMVKDIVSEAGRGAIDGYSKGKIDKSTNLNDKNYIEILKKLLKYFKK